MSEQKTTKKAKKPPSKLGRGLSSLMQDITPAIANTIDDKTKPHVETKQATPTSPTEQIMAPPSISTAGAKIEKGVYTVPIERIERNPNQPRRYFDPKKLEELTQSIKDKGILQPILVRPLPPREQSAKISKKPHFQIVAGERRWQASVHAGLTEMPVLVRHLSDQEVLEIGVVENVQRADLNPIEEAMAYQALKEQFGRRQEDIAEAVGKSRSHVANCMRLLALPERAREYVRDGKMSAGHARAILAAQNPFALSELIISKNLSVREAENWVRKERSQNRELDLPDTRKNADTRFIEQQLTEHLGLKTKVTHKDPGGKLILHYRTLEELEDLIAKLKKT